MTGFVLSPAAREDVLAIWDYIAERDLAAADRFRDRLWAAFERLAAMPGLGHRRADLTDQPVRFWRVYRYFIIYRGERAPIEIVRVIAADRDIATLLSEPP